MFFAISFNSRSVRTNSAAYFFYCHLLIDIYLTWIVH